MGKKCLIQPPNQILHYRLGRNVNVAGTADENRVTGLFLQIDLESGALIAYCGEQKTAPGYPSRGSRHAIDGVYWIRPVRNCGCAGEGIGSARGRRTDG